MRNVNNTSVLVFAFGATIFASMAASTATPGPAADPKVGHCVSPLPGKEWGCMSQEFGRIVSLDGPWQLGEGGMEAPPKTFPSVVPVPGLVHLARPAFAEVGLPGARRQAFWYRRTFILDEDPPEAVRLKIGKAMFGAKGVP